MYGAQRIRELEREIIALRVARDVAEATVSTLTESAERLEGALCDAARRFRDIALQCSAEKTDAERYARLNALDWKLCHERAFADVPTDD